jgi:hypothetical protein
VGDDALGVRALVRRKSDIRTGRRGKLVRHRAKELEKDTLCCPGISVCSSDSRIEKLCSPVTASLKTR